VAIPGDWQSARYTIRELGAAAAQAQQPGALFGIRIDYLPYDVKSLPHPLFAIWIFKALEAPASRRASGASVSQTLAETPEFVYVATRESSSAYTAADDAQLYGRMQPSWAQIKAAFSLSGAGAVTTGGFRPATGNYETRLSAAEVSGRTIKLSLRQDGTATLSTEMTGRGRPLVDSARWNQKDDVVMLQLLGRDGRATGTPLIWTIVGEHLVPKFWDRFRYGSGGLSFRKQR
jgi:hypothetical protein